MLSERETHTLAAIERRLIDDDPGLAQLFERRGGPARRSRARNWPILVVVVALLLLMVVVAVLALPIALMICAALLPCALISHLCWTGALHRPDRRALGRRAR